MLEQLSLLPHIIGTPSASRLQFHVQGIVQGVGFRPFIYNLATRHNLSGYVYNNCAGVYIEVEGAPGDLADFHRALAKNAPPLAKIEHVTVTPLPTVGTAGFTIVASQHDHDTRTLVSPDLAICEDCLRELFDPNDRRYRYPFINCTNCGPRFTIIEDIPYDRPVTTMAPFALCPTCQAEYDDPTNRRFHAQPNACPTCGPHLTLHWAADQLITALSGYSTHLPAKKGPSSGEAALQQAQQVLIYGGIVAVKGIGGFHLACDASNPQAVARLRQHKSRGDKPFAIMARDLASVLEIAEVDATETALLSSPERPIVLLKKRPNDLVCDLVAPNLHHIGVMLPYSPLHHLLFAPSAATAPTPMPAWLVMTSANFADEPIVTDNAAAMALMPRLADCVLTHNRAIHVPCDDSVIRVHAGRPLPIRRSRGYSPLPIHLPFAVPPLLAVGGELKNTFCLACDHHAFLSQHIGDMHDLDTLESFDHLRDHLQKLFRISPELIACDLHPGYLPTFWAEQFVETHDTPITLIKVQHHHAHLAALLVEHALPNAMPVIGFCFDGTGYGTDGAIWGGEVLVGDYRHVERVAHLNYFPLPGGDTAIRYPYRTALAALWAAGLAWHEGLPPVAATSLYERDILAGQLRANLNCALTSSMGRLFDVVATLAGVRQRISYEGQAAIELETLVDSTLRASYHFDLPTSTTPCFDATSLLRDVVTDALDQVNPAIIATKFHNAVTNLIVEISMQLRAQRGINTVALSGGVFQNLALLRPTVRRLEAIGFEVLVHTLVPPNDGGLALGQAVVAAAQSVAR